MEGGISISITVSSINSLKLCAIPEFRNSLNVTLVFKSKQND